MLIFVVGLDRFELGSAWNWEELILDRMVLYLSRGNMYHINFIKFNVDYNIGYMHVTWNIEHGVLRVL